MSELERSGDRPRLRASDADRDRVLNVVQEAHAAGRLDLTEVDERQSAVLKARFVDELWPQVRDLPEAAVVQDLDPDAATRLPAVRARQEVAPSAQAAKFDVAVMSGRDVVVEPGTKRHTGVEFWGGDNYDLTHALGPGVTVTLNLFAVMAGADIFVPEGVRVVDDTINIMAGNSIAYDARGDGTNGTLRLTGFSFWAGHDVKLAPGQKLR